jgi:hypothetical protein
VTVGDFLLKGRQDRQRGVRDDSLRVSVLPSAGTPAITDLQVIKFSLELLDSTVSHLQVFVKTITLGDELRIQGKSVANSLSPGRKRSLRVAPIV